jgi:hypothetical protein
LGHGSQIGWFGVYPGGEQASADKTLHLVSVIKAPNNIMTDTTQDEDVVERNLKQKDWFAWQTGQGDQGE